MAPHPRRSSMVSNRGTTWRPLVGGSASGANRPASLAKSRGVSTSLTPAVMETM